MAFTLKDEFPQYRDALGNLCAGGTLTFFQTSTSSPKVVYAEKELSTSLGSTITLDADGRHSERFWLAEDVAYRVILKDSDGVTVWTADDVRSTDTAISSGLPAAEDLDEGQVLASDGTPGGWYGADLPAIPSMTGHAGKYLTNDEESLSWAALASYDADNLPGGIAATASASGSVVIGDVRIQWGADTGPNTGTLHSTKAVTFGTAFSGSPYFIGVTPADDSSTGEGAGVSSQYTSPGTTGFTANFYAGAEDAGGVAEINQTIAFTWLAIGPA